MSIWNAVLQTTHSALIDELNEKFPENRLELGLPKRFHLYEALPHQTVSVWQTLHSENPAEPGIAVSGLAGSKGQTAGELQALATRLRSRFEAEFKFRGIPVRTGDWTAHPPSTRMVIWLPISIIGIEPAPTFDLCLGI